MTIDVTLPIPGVYELIIVCRIPLWLQNDEVYQFFPHGPVSLLRVPRIDEKIVHSRSGIFSTGAMKKFEQM